MWKPQWETAAVLFMGLVVALPTAARAQSRQVRRHLTTAERLYRALDNEGALEEVKKASRLGRGVEDDVAVSLYEGIIFADMGKQAQSNSAFRAALLLNPNANLPLKVSPKVKKAFDAIRQSIHRNRASPPTPGVQAAQTAPLVAEAEPAAKVRPGIRPLPVALLGVSVAIGGAGGYFGYRSYQDANSAQAAVYQSKRGAYLSSAKREATYANVGYAAAGAALVGAVLTYLLGGP
jgi:hypothetical protein